MDLPTKSYTWKLNVKTASSESCSRGKYYQGNPFRMHGLDWVLRYYPNYKNEGSIELYLILMNFHHRSLVIYALVANPWRMNNNN